MGSFPTILRFDSLGQQKYYIQYISINISHTLFLMFFFRFKYTKYSFIKNIKLPKNTPIQKNKQTPAVLFYINQKFLKQFMCVIGNLFSIGCNVLFLDFKNNYNYLPVNICVESFKKQKNKCISNYIKYFNIKAIVLLNIPLKKSFLKNLFKLKLINLVFNQTTTPYTSDIYLPNKSISIPDVSCYILYLIVLDLYLKFFF